MNQKHVGVTEPYVHQTKQIIWWHRSNKIEKVETLVAMASNLRAMASNLLVSCSLDVAETSFRDPGPFPKVLTVFRQCGS